MDSALFASKYLGQLLKLEQLRWDTNKKRLIEYFGVSRYELPVKDLDHFAKDSFQIKCLYLNLNSRGNSL